VLKSVIKNSEKETKQRKPFLVWERLFANHCPHRKNPAMVHKKIKIGEPFQKPV
jgi:hypothetical protein